VVVQPLWPACETGPVSDPALPNADDAERLAFAIPPVDDPPDWIEIELLDPTDPDDRALLIRAAHPELDAAIADGRETAVVGSQEINPRLHMALHEVVASQLIGGDPPEVWATAQRLGRLGYDRHEILHMLAGAMSGELWEALQGRSGYDHAAHVAALEALPESWSASGGAVQRRPRAARRMPIRARSAAEPLGLRGDTTAGAKRVRSRWGQRARPRRAVALWRDRILQHACARRWRPGGPRAPRWQASR
jgi:hypothetical protein